MVGITAAKDLPRHIVPAVLKALGFAMINLSYMHAKLLQVTWKQAVVTSRETKSMRLIVVTNTNSIGVLPNLAIPRRWPIAALATHRILERRKSYSEQNKTAEAAEGRIS